MRLMGNAVTGEPANSTAVQTTTEGVVKSIQSDPGMPRTAQGSSVVEVPGTPNAALQAWIVHNTTDGSGYIPGQSPYSASDPSLARPVLNTGKIDAPTAAVGNNDIAGRSGVGIQQNPPLSQQTREAIADGASNVSRVAGLVEATAAATAAAYPQSRPFSVPLVAGAAGIGATADFVEQIARPDLNQVVKEQFLLGVPAYGLMQRFPAAAPLINEIKERLK